jgi:DNA-binding GntR family transcriptional regulator
MARLECSRATLYRAVTALKDQQRPHRLRRRGRWIPLPAQRAGRHV